MTKDKRIELMSHSISLLNTAELAMSMVNHHSAELQNSHLLTEAILDVRLKRRRLQKALDNIKNQPYDFEVVEVGNRRCVVQSGDLKPDGYKMTHPVSSSPHSHLVGDPEDPDGYWAQYNARYGHK